MFLIIYKTIYFASKESYYPTNDPSFLNNHKKRRSHDRKCLNWVQGSSNYAVLSSFHFEMIPPTSRNRGTFLLAAPQCRLASELSQYPKWSRNDSWGNIKSGSSFAKIKRMQLLLYELYNSLIFRFVFINFHLIHNCIWVSLVQADFR